MTRWQAWALLFISLGFVLAGLFILLRDPSAGAGWSAVLFFGACAAVGWIELFGLPRKEARDLIHVTDDQHTRLTAHGSPAHGLAYGLACLAFGLAGLFMAREGIAPTWLAVVMISFFGLGGVVLLVRAFDWRPRLVIDEMGIRQHKRVVTWNQVRGLSLVSIHGNPFLCVHTGDSYLPSNRQSWLTRKTSRLNRSLGFGDITFNLTDLELTAEEVLVVAESAWQKARDKSTR